MDPLTGESVCLILTNIVASGYVRCVRDGSMYDATFHIYDNNGTLRYEKNTSSLVNYTMAQPTDLPPQEVLYVPTTKTLVTDYANLITNRELSPMLQNSLQSLLVTPYAYINYYDGFKWEKLMSQAKVDLYGTTFTQNSNHYSTTYFEAVWKIYGSQQLYVTMN